MNEAQPHIEPDQDALAAGSPIEPGVVKTSLSPREREVLTKVASGMSNKQIGEEMGISAKTAEAHRQRLSKKLGAKNACHAVYLACQLNLISM